MSRAGRVHLLNAAYAATWAILPDKLEAVFDLLVERTSGEWPSKMELRRRGFTAMQAKPFNLATQDQQKQIAVLPMHGVIAHHAGWEMQASGGTSTVAFGNAFDAAMANPDVGAIVIDCDSPGGTAEGVAELAAKIRAARGKGKDLIGVANANCHSAAYWALSQCDEVVVTPSGSIGNIGVMTVRTDTSEMEAKEGIKRTLIKAGAHKGEGAPFEPMTDEEKAATQKRVNECYAMFVGDVAKGRGDSIDNVKAGYGEGRSVSAKEAVKIGLADRVATMEQVIADLGGKAPAAKRNTSMISMRAESEVETCPDCGREMKDGECPECDEPETDAVAETISRAAAAVATSVLANADGAPSLTASTTPLSTPITPVVVPEARQPTKQESATMPENTQTPAEMLAVVRAAEAERVKQIRAVCADHGLSLKADKFIEDGLTIDAVRAAILEEKRSVTQATRPKVSVTSVEQRSDRDPKKGFANHREFFTAVLENRARDLSQVKDDRLKALARRDADDEQNGGEVAYLLPTGIYAAAGSDEQGNYSDSYGGFLGNATTRLPGLRTIGWDGDPTTGRTTSIPMASTTVEINARVDKNHTTSVTGGLTFSRRAETVAVTTSRMQTELVTLKANSLFGTGIASEEVLTDSPISYAALMDAGFRDQRDAHMLNEKIYGLGGSEYEGVTKSPALVSIAKEANQSADTIVTQNLLKMRARCWRYGQAIWMANQDTLPQLGVLSVGVGTAGALVYQQSMREDLPDMLLGRPIFYNEFMSTIGDQHDIMLINWAEYLEGTYQPLQSAESIHVRFLNHERVFKFWERNAGQGWWRSALTPKKSTATLSPFVTLDAR